MNPELAPEEITRFPQPGIGKVEQTITPTQPGRVKFQATYWPARLYAPEYDVTLMPDETVTVIGRQGITLLVAPFSEAADSNLSGNKAKPGNVGSRFSTWTQKLGSILGFRLD